MRLDGALCLITGGSSGIGRATAIEMARRGATLALAARNADALREALNDVAKVSPASTIHVCDVSDPLALERTVAEVLEAHGRIDVLFANAGYGRYGPIVDLNYDEIDAMVRTNVCGQMFAARAVLPHMMERRRGHLVFMSSVAGRIPTPLMAVYHGTKFANTGFAQSLLYEVEPFGIGVGVVYPGAIETPFFSDAEFHMMRTPKKIPVARVAKAIARGVQRGSYDISVPRRYRFAAALQAIAPGVIRRGARMYSSSSVPRP